MATPENARALLRLTAGAAVLVDLEGRMALSSPSACELLGRTHGELARTRWQDLTHPDDVPAGELVWSEARQQLERRRLLKRYTLRGGRLLFAELDTQPVVVDGRAVGVLSQLRPWRDLAACPSLEDVGSSWRVRARPPKGRDGRSWQLVYQRPDGTRYQRAAGTDDPEAARRLADAEQRRLNGETLDLEAVVRQFQAYRKAGQSRPSTLQRYDEGLRRVLQALGRREVSPETILAVQDELRGELSARTVNLYLGFARTAWTWALERGLVDRAWPAPRKLQVRETDKRPMTADESALLLDALGAVDEGRYLGLFALLVETGCRAGEACRLEGRDVDRARGEVRFRPETTKTGRGRAVPVSRELLELLPRVDPRAPLWTGPRTGRKLSTTSVYCVWRRVKGVVGLANEPLDVHSLRRGWITDAHRAGVPLAESMRLTGHRTTRVHLAYTQNAPDDQAHHAAETVRAWRAATCGDPPPDPPPPGGGHVIEPPDTEGDSGPNRSGTSRDSLAKAMQQHDFRNPSPTELERLHALIETVAGQGEREAAALLALANHAGLRARLIQLAQQNR